MEVIISVELISPVEGSFDTWVFSRGSLGTMGVIISVELISPVEGSFKTWFISGEELL